MIRERYEILFTPDDLTADERQGVAKFAAHITKLAVDEDWDGLTSFLSNVLGDAVQNDPLAVEKLAKIVDVFALTGDEIEKQAFTPMAESMRELAATLPMKQLQQQRAEEGQRGDAVKGSLKQIMTDRPELLADPKSLAQHFEVLSRFAPDIAANPTVSGNLMLQLHKMGPGSMTHQMLGELRKLQESMNAERAATAEQTSKAVSPFTSARMGG